MFGTILLSIVTVMHLYVCWRSASVPLIRRHVTGKVRLGVAATLWALFALGRVVGHGGTGVAAGVLEFVGMTWMATLLLLMLPLLAVDLITFFGWLWPRQAPRLRGWALLVGALLSAAALVQGLRPPVVETHVVHLDGLPTALDGTVLVGLSDLHLGNLIGKRWLAARINQVRALQPDLVVLLGDIIEGHGAPGRGLLEALGSIPAPMGVWAVPGNHESHGKGYPRYYAAAGIRLLQNGWGEAAPGLVIAGVADLTSAARRGQGGDFIAKALAGRPAGATVLLSHTPWRAEAAAASGVGLMLCGHTHGGQIWPFSYLVRQRYPLLQGRYDVGGMPVIVSRGAGTWGPRMRLWRPGEILRVILRCGGRKSPHPEKTGGAHFTDQPVDVEVAVRKQGETGFRFSGFRKRVPRPAGRHRQAPP